MLKESWVIFTCVSGHTFAINPESIKNNPSDPEEVEEDARCPVCLRAAEGIVDRTVLIATNRDDEVALDDFYESSYQKSHNEFMEKYNYSINSFIVHRKKEAEENLKRHDEHVSKNLGASVMIGSIGNNPTGLSVGSKDSPVTVINQVFNYEKASVILEAIKGKFDELPFNSEFGDDVELVKQLVVKALKQVKDRDDPTLIQKSLAVVYDIAIRVTSGVIASGIIALLGRL